MMENYGITKKSESLSEVQLIKESVALKGFKLVKNVFDAATMKKMSDSLDVILVAQEKSFSREDLKMIKEEDLVRAPFSHDPLFLELITNSLIRQVVESLLGNYYILHLQNGILNKPSKVHHQVSWHRDLPYQDFVSSEPLGINAFLCVDEFSVSSGATSFLPFSHKIPFFPSKEYVAENESQLIAGPGSVLFFDSMLYHKAGLNSGNFIRRGINTMFIRPILKQQLEVPSMLKGKHSEDEFLRKVLGYESAVPSDVDDFRKRRIAKLRK